jgi:hypothetical protein
MDDQRDAGRADATLRRPAVDPDIPAADRALLTAPGALLTPACHARPARYRDYLPADPRLRGTTIDGAVTGMTAAALAAIGGATPLAIGTLVFQDPAGWQSARRSAGRRPVSPTRLPCRRRACSPAPGRPRWGGRTS